MTNGGISWCSLVTSFNWKFNIFACTHLPGSQRSHASDASYESHLLGRRSGAERLREDGGAERRNNNNDNNNPAAAAVAGTGGGKGKKPLRRKGDGSGARGGVSGDQWTAASKSDDGRRRERPFFPTLAVAARPRSRFFTRPPAAP